MSLLTALIVEKSHILAGIYFIFLKKRPRQNLKDFQDQIWTLVKRSENYNQFHILRLFDVLPNFPFTASEMMGDYYL